MSRKWTKWYRNEVDEEIKGVDSRHNVNITKEVISYFREDYVGGRARVTKDEARLLRRR